MRDAQGVSPPELKTKNKVSCDALPPSALSFKLLLRCSWAALALLLRCSCAAPALLLGCSCAAPALLRRPD